jgi:hypothetical protein
MPLTHTYTGFQNPTALHAAAASVSLTPNLRDQIAKLNKPQACVMTHRPAARWLKTLKGFGNADGSPVITDTLTHEEAIRINVVINAGVTLTKKMISACTPASRGRWQAGDHYRATGSYALRIDAATQEKTTKKASAKRGSTPAAHRKAAKSAVDKHNACLDAGGVPSLNVKVGNESRDASTHEAALALVLHLRDRTQELEAEVKKLTSKPASAPAGEHVFDVTL